MDKRSEEFFSSLFEQVLELRILTDALYEVLSEPERTKVKMTINKYLKNDLYLGNLLAAAPFGEDDIKQIARELVKNLP